MFNVQLKPRRTPWWDRFTVDLPNVKTPRFEIPRFEAPEVSLPRFEMPHFERPHVDVPRFSMPEVPRFSMPEVPHYRRAGRFDWEAWWPYMLGAAAFGAAVAFLFDPQMGRTRRAQLRDRLGGRLRRARHDVVGRGQDLSNRAYGVAHSIGRSTNGVDSDRTDEPGETDAVQAYHHS